MNGERVGRWTAPPRSPAEFVYDEEWLRSPAARPLSLSLPLGPPGTTYRGPAVEHWFDNLLPDNRAIRERLRQRFGARSGRTFDLLAEIGRDCIGAVQLLPEDSDAPDVHRIEGHELDEAAIERVLDEAVGGVVAGADEVDFRISLAGNQEKTALLRVDDRWLRPVGATPTTHILKLPLGVFPHGVDMSQSVHNEWLCAQVLRAYDVPVAACAIERFGRHEVLVVDRFDRRRSEDRRRILRIPQEDFCQVTGTSRDHKYEADGGPGIRRILDQLLGSANAEADRADFFRTQVLFWMLCAIDGHAKNFSVFLEPAGRYRLTPRYDVLSAFPVLGTKAGRYSPHKVKMAMAVHGENSRHYLWQDIQRRHWTRTARLCGLANQAAPLIDSLVAATPAAIATVERVLPPRFPAEVADPVLQGLARAAEKLAAG